MILFILQECLASQYRSKYALVQQVGKKKWRWREGGGKHCFILVNWRMSKDYSDTWHKQDKCTGVASLLFVSVWTQKVKVTAGCLSLTSSMRRKIPPELGRDPEASQTVICIPWSNGWQREGLSTCNLCRHTCVQSFKEPTLRSQMGTMPCVC